jgi:hypothetical protein
MSTAQPQLAVGERVGEAASMPAITVYGHSPLIYWWPVWLVGLVMALMTYMEGVAVQFGDTSVIMHPSKGLGVVYTVVFLMVIIMTNLTVRGAGSLTVIVAILALTFFFAYMNWWDDIFATLGNLAMYMNLGFYVFFSSAIFVVWLLTLVVFDRFNYWVFRPGQVVHYQLFGGGEQTYDTTGMSVYKLRDDLFRHWVLGLGSGDLHVSTTGAKKQDFVIPNVLFIGGKLDRVQRLVSMKPDEALGQVITAGDPS